jgi:UDP-glucose 4-epimerase
MKQVLVSGAGGFVGKRFLELSSTVDNVETVSLQDPNWKQKNFSHIDAVVHLAGKAHDMSKIDDRVYFDINYELTKQFFEKLSRDGVRHFIYISSTKVYGEGAGIPLNEQSVCKPEDAYGKSKLAAENFLLEQKNMIISIIRPPLVYGDGVKGNLEKLLRLCNSNRYLPFAGIRNKRSMVFIDNLVGLIQAVINQEKNGIFVAGDPLPVSTTELVSLIRQGLGRKKRLFSIPGLFRLILKKIKPALFTRLFGNFYIENLQTKKMLNFTPPYSAAFGIVEMAKSFIKKNKDEFTV